MSKGGTGLEGMGRRELEDLVLSLRGDLARVAKISAQRDDMLGTLTATQHHCSQQLEELRGWRRGELVELATAMAIARRKHPEGSDLTSLVSEVGEVARAMYSEPQARVREELLDAAVVAMRLFFGEVKRVEVGFRTGPDTPSKVPS